MAKRLNLRINKNTHETLTRLNGSFGDRSQFLRLALRRHLIEMTPVHYALALGKEQGPHPHRLSFNLETPGANKWHNALATKAQDLETTPAELARTCLVLFLADLEAELTRAKGEQE